MRRILLPMAAVLLTAACGSSTQTPVPQPASRAATSSSSASTTAASSSPTTPSSRSLQIAIPAAKLPYKPAPGVPPLDDVKVIKTAHDSCGIPADDSGNEGQLLNVQWDAVAFVATFEFTNPCQQPISYAVHVTEAFGSATGPSAGPGAQVDSQVIQPGQSVTLHFPVDPKPGLSTDDLKRIWLGITQITKHPAP